MPKYVVRLVLGIVALIVVMVAARFYFIPDSFYDFGTFRADSVGEIAAQVPKYRGSEYCADCHGERHAEWTEGIHKVVKCEVCHTAAGDHPANGKLPVPTDTVQLCTLCHEAMPSRPAAQRQIVVAEHAGTAQCITCHNPHSPKIDTSVPTQSVAATDAAMPNISTCLSCHGPTGEGLGSFPALAGKGADYLARQLMAYRSGERVNGMMNGIARSLSDQEIDGISDYFASLNKGAEK